MDLRTGARENGNQIVRAKIQSRMTENRGACALPEAAGGRAQHGGTTALSCSGPLSVFSFPLSAFTLLEVLVALAIFAMAAVVLGATYVNALNAYHAAGRQNEYDADLRFVRAALLAEPDRQKATDGGDLDLGTNKHAHWQADIAATDTVDLFSVTWTCDIVDPARPQNFHTSQTFMLLRPTWSDPVERTKLLDQVKQRILEMQGAAP
jgi:general secretion pathway protein I